MKKLYRIPTLSVLTGLALVSCFVWIGTFAAAASIPGTAMLSGTVTAPQPFKAAQVYIRNKDKRMLYMVYTIGGRYHATALFPGNYEVSVKTKGLQGLESDVTTLVLRAGQNATLNLPMHKARAEGLKTNVEYQPFNEIYPPGPGRDVAMRTCIYCHGPDFLPGKSWNEGAWNGAIDFMTGEGNPQGAMIQPKDMTPQDRKALMQYLLKNFGPGSRPRAVKIEKDIPVDEAELAHAEYIEYYFPPDPPGKGVHDPKYANVSSPFGHRRVGQDPQLDGHGNVWVTDRGFPIRICRLDPRTGMYKEFLTPEPTAGVHDLEIDRKNGILWLPENEGVPAGNLKLRAFNIKTEKWEQAYLMDPNNVIPKGTLKHAQSLTFDSKGNIYFVFILGSAIGKWDRETKKMSTYLLPTPNAFPYGIVTDKDDNVWLAEFHGSKIAKFDPRTSKFTEYNPPIQPALIRRLNVDLDGKTIWFGLFSAGKLERLDPSTGKITQYNIPHQDSEPYDMMMGRTGKLWISDGGQGGTLIRFDPKTHKFVFFPTPQRADMPSIRVTRDGSVWYSPRSSQRYPGIGVLHPDMRKVTTLAAYY